MASSRAGRACAALAAILLAEGCDLTFPWSSGTVPDGPRNLVATEDSLDIDEVLLSWTATVAQDHYEAQGRASGDWQTVNPLIPGDATTFPVRLDDSFPERTQVAFRLRAMIGGAPSEWSNEATLVRGIRAPSTFAAEMGMTYATRSGPVTVTWTNASQVATVIELERSRLDGAGSPTTWARIGDASLASGRHLDHLLEDGVAYAYRVRVGAEGAWSSRREVQTPPVDLAAPWGVRAFVEGGVVRLTWTNQSTTAEALTVGRYTRGWPNWDYLVELPATQAMWTEPMPVWPVMSYDLTASRQSAYLYAKTEAVRIEPFTLPGPPALAASARLLPEHERAARDAGGRFHLAQQSYDAPRIHRATAAGHETYVLPGAYRLADPGVIADGQGAPHTVFLRAVTGATEIVHAWWGGSAWQEEVVATDDVAQWVSNTAQAWFGLDGSGIPQVVYRRTEPFPAQEALVHVARSGGAWTATQVATPSVPDFSRWSSAFAVAPDGSAQVAMIGQSLPLGGTTTNLIVLCSRTAAGAWSDQVVPTAGGFSFDGPWVVAGTGGDAAVAYFATTGGDVEVVREQAGTWSAPETAVSRLPDGYQPSLRLAGTPDLGRLAIVAVTSLQLGVHVRDAGGWQGVAVGPGSDVQGSLGLGPTGGVWALFPHDSAGGGRPLPYSLFDEVP